jgi:hypothetical protein
MKSAKNMNSVTVTGVVAVSELRKTATGQELMNVDLLVDANATVDSPKIRCAFFCRTGRPRSIAVGSRVLVVGSLKHRRDTGLFIAVQEVYVLAVNAESDQASDDRSAAELPHGIDTLQR